MRTIIIILALVFAGCTVVRSSEGVYWTAGQAKVERCESIRVQPDGTTEKFDCEFLESEGVSSEFAGVIRAVFFWWPF